MAAPQWRPSRLVALALGAVAVPALGQGYNEARAVQFARLAGAAYCPDASLTSWSCGAKCVDAVTNVQICHGTSTKAFVGRWDGQCVVSFQGTSNVYALIKDLQFLHTATQWPACGHCQVHGGFLSEWRSLQGCVTAQLAALGCPAGSQIRTTGHSLGAALNALAMLDLTSQGWRISESYDFGSPRTGDGLFTAALQQFADRSYRVTHRMDPIVQLPPANLAVVDTNFRHKQPEIFYEGDGLMNYLVCALEGDMACSAKYQYLPVAMLMIPDHIYYLGVQTSMFGCSGGMLGDGVNTDNAGNATLLV